MVSIKIEVRGKDGRAHRFHHLLSPHNPIAERSLGHLIYVLLQGEFWQYDEVRITKERGKENGEPEKE